MDDCEIYANVERPRGKPESRERCGQRSRHAGEDFNQDTKTRQAAFSVAAAGYHEERLERSYRGAAVFLALLCFLLLIGFITMGFLYTERHSEYEKQRALLVTIYDNRTHERDQFLELERRTELLQQRLDAVSKNNAELLKMLQDSAASLKTLTEERDNLKSVLRNGWVYFSGSSYLVSSTKKSWDQSRNDCLQKGADLMIINSREEQAFANRFEKYMWIGLTDVASEGSWKWVDGTRMSTSYWGSGEPNGGKSENCGDIKNPGTENSWNDEPCSTSLFWICEKKIFQ